MRGWYFNFHGNLTHLQWSWTPAWWPESDRNIYIIILHHRITSWKTQLKMFHSQATIINLHDCCLTRKQFLLRWLCCVFRFNLRLIMDSLEKQLHHQLVLTVTSWELWPNGWHSLQISLLYGRADSHSIQNWSSVLQTSREIPLKSKKKVSLLLHNYREWRLDGWHSCFKSQLENRLQGDFVVFLSPFRQMQR